MKKIGVLITILVFMGALIIGNIHWNNKIDETVSRSINTSVIHNNSSNNDNGAEESVPGFSLKREELEQLLASLPAQIANMFLANYDNGKSVHMMIVGSPAIASNTNGWSVQVKEHLEKVYGADFLKMTIVQFDGTSTEFVDSEEAKSVIDAKPDLVFFEALTLEDNGQVEIEISHENIKNFIGRIREANPESVILVQPPHPIHAATYYPHQVSALAEFTEDEGIPYFDHWPNWPDPDSDEITHYLNDEGMPNENGHELWADAVIRLFTGEK